MAGRLISIGWRGASRGGRARRWGCRRRIPPGGRLAAAITARTRALVVVSPSNPTGWTAGRDDLTALLTLARRHGLWIIADEIYSRFWYEDGPRAPSFHDVMTAEDRVLFVNTFSKNWAM